MDQNIRKIRILYINHENCIRGAGLSLAYLIRELDRGKYEPIIACDLQEPSAREFFRSEGLDTYNLKARRFSHTTSSYWPIYSPLGVMFLIRWLILRFPAECREIKKLLRDISPDIVHLNSVTLLPYAPTIQKTGTAVVLHTRESVVRGLFGVRRAWLRHLGRNAIDAIIYICQDNKSRLTGEHPKGRVIYNPVDFSKFDRNIDQQKARQSLGIPDNSRVLLFAGGSGLLIKGVFALLESLMKLRKQFPNLICLMPGAAKTYAKKRGWLKSVLLGPTENEQIESRIKELDLKDMVIQTPFSYEVEKFFAACDIVVVPFVKPHFARPVIEAGAMAKPIVASRIGGVEEVVKDGETGLLVEPGNAVDLAEKIAVALNDPGLAQKLGEGGYTQAHRLFDAKRNAAATIQVYEEVLKNKCKYYV